MSLAWLLLIGLVHAEEAAPCLLPPPDGAPVLLEVARWRDVPDREIRIAKILLREGLPGEASRVLRATLLRAPGGVADVEALACLNRAALSHPSFGPGADAQLIAAANVGQPVGRAVLREAALRSVIWALRHGEGASADSVISKLSDALGPAHLLWGRGLLAARVGNHRESARVLALASVAYEEAPDALGTIPATLAAEVDEVLNLELARARYAIGEHEGAAARYRKISRRSNRLVEALSELAWAELLAGNSREAAGTALSLRMGRMRDTFAPEAPMVLAMTLVELCRFPEAMRAIGEYRARFEPLARWLETLEARGAIDRAGDRNAIDRAGDRAAIDRAGDRNAIDLYALAVAGARGSANSTSVDRGASPVPIPILREWLGSEGFLGSQSAINALISEQDSASRISKEAELALAKTREDLAKVEARLRRVDLPTDDRDLREHERLHALERMLARELPRWKAVLAGARERAARGAREWRARAEESLRELSGRMRVQLAEVDENLRLVEAEAMQGAADEIVRRQGERIPEERRERVVEEGKWDWGRSIVSRSQQGRSIPGSGEVFGQDDGAGELWEDELGSFTASVSNACRGG